MPKFYIKTYGCQMNERDSEQVAHSLVARGYEPVASEAEADVVLLNTCSVRDMADQKALGKMGMLGVLAKRRPEVVFGFLGCMAQARGDSLFNGLPHLDLRYRRGNRLAEYHSSAAARAETGDGLRFHHARLQHALHLLHRAADARSRTKPHD
jgi:tRNA-2-methylthio-N6-dimethylallyladenosine synthase